MSKVSRILARPLATLLAIAMTITGVPGVPMSTVMAAESGKVSYAFEGVDESPAWSADVIDYTAAVDGSAEELATVTSYKFGEATSGLTVTVADEYLKADATYTYDGSKWMNGDDEATFAVTVKSGEDSVEPQDGDTVTVSGYVAAVDPTPVSAKPIPKTLPDPDEAAGTGYTGAWSVTGSTLGTIAVNDGKFTLTSDQLVSVYESGEDVTITLTKTPKTYTAKYDVKFYDGDTQEEAPAGWTPIADGENALTFNTESALATAPTFDGYDFSGWFETSEYTGTAITAYTASEELAEGKTFYGKFTKKQAVETVKLTISGDERVASVSYQAFKGESADGDAVTDAALPNRKLEIDVPKGDTVKITEIATVNTYDMITAVKQGETSLEADSEDGSYETAALTDDAAVTITTGKMLLDDIKLTANSNLSEDGINPAADIVEVGNSEITADNGKKFVKAGTDFAFMLNAKENYKISGLTYAIGTETAKSIDITGIAYTIPKEDILAAVIAGKPITVTATVVEAKKTITVDAAKAKDATVAYTEYKKTGENTYTSVSSGTVTLDATSGKGTINVETGNVVALKVTPASANVLTSSSVKIGNTKVAPVTDSASGLPVGSYAVEADDAKTVTITQYKNVDVKVTEAKVTVSGNSLTITDTKVSPYYGTDGLVNSITVTPQNTQGAYDYEILAPTAKYGNKAITVKTASKPGLYVIDKEDVEKAVEAGKDIEITAVAKAIPKSTVTVKVTGDVDTIIYGEFKGVSPVDPKHSNISLMLTPDKDNPTVKTGEITFQTGNGLLTQVTMGSKYKNVDFLRVTSAGKQFAVLDANPSTGTYMYSLTGLTNGSTVEIATARIKASEIGPDGDIYVASSSSSSSDKPGVWGNVVTRDSADIIPVEEVNYFKNDAELLVGFDTYGPQSNIKKYAVSNPQVTVNGSSAKALSRSLYTNDELPFTEYYAIPANYLADIAFATPKDEALSGGSKITYKAKITATATQVGYKLQPVFVNGDAGFTATVKDNGKKVLLSSDDVVYEPATSGAAPLATGQAYLVEYGDQGVINIAPNAGFKLDSVTLLSSADYDKTVAAYATKKTDHGYSWTVFDQSDWDEAKKKKFADDIAALNKSQSIADDGTCTITLAKVQNAYSVVVTTEEEYALTVDGEVVDNTTEASPKENRYNNSLVFKLVSGENEIDIATATVSYADGQNEDKSTKWTGSAEAATVTVDKKSATISEEKMATLAGKLIKVDVIEDKSEGAVTKTAYFRVTDKLAAEALKLDLGEGVSTLDLKIGSTKTVSLTGAVDSSRFSAEINSPYAGLIKVTKGVKDEKNTLTFTTAAADWNSLKNKTDITLTLKDNVNDEQIGDPIPVSVTADPLSVDDLTVTASATANSIVLTMKGLDAEVKSLDGLYYLINASTTAHSSCLISEIGNLLVPVEKGAANAEQKYTIKLTEYSDLFDPSPVTYTGTVALVQVSGTDEGWYDAEQKIAPSSDPETKAFSATTKTNTYTVEEDGKQVEKDVVFATKLKVNKLLGKTKVYTGMEAVDVISVEYPDAAKNVPVTDYAKKLQKVELVNTKTNDVWNTDYDPDVISEDNDVVTIYPENIAAGSYKVVAYALEPFGKEVTASYSFKVLQGIKGLTVTAPTTRIYKAPGKAATVKAALTYDPAKPATKKVVWSIADATGEDITIPGITVKDGKVTVDKKLAFDEDIEFTVKAAAADYAGNDAVDWSAPITLTTTVSQPAYLTMNGEPITNNKKDYISDDIDGKTLGAHTADGTEIDDVSFKVSGAAKLDEYGRLVVTKLGKVNITATVTDGSVKKPFKVSFSIASDSGLRFMLSDVTGSNGVQGGSIIPGVTEYPFTNAYAASEPMELEIGSRSGSLIANTVSIKGGKAINKNKVMGGHNYYEITPSAHETVITITDKSVKPAVKYTIKVTNTKITTAKTATKVGAKNLYDSAFKNGASVTKDNKGKIFTHLEFDDPVAYTNAGAYNDVTYTVSTKDLKVTKALLAVTKDDEDGDFSDCVMDNTEDGVVTLGEGGTFTIRYADENGNFDIPKGTYTFTVTPIDDEGNAIAKTATVKVTAAPAPKAKVTVKSTTLKDFDKEQGLEFSTQNNIVVSLKGDPATDSETSASFGSAEKPQVLGINTKGIINRFASYFYINDGKLVCGKAPEAAGGYTQKSGITGWVAYTYRNLDGSWTTQYAKVTVKPAKDKDITAALGN